MFAKGDRLFDFVMLCMVIVFVHVVIRGISAKADQDWYNIGPLPSITYKGCKTTSYTLGDYSDMSATIIMKCGSEEKDKGVVVQILGKYSNKICSDGWEYTSIMGITIDQHPSHYSFLNLPPYGRWEEMKHETPRGRCWEQVPDEGKGPRGMNP